MDKRINLIEGNISKALIKLALPIMATSFIQMLYNLTDTMWLGRLSTEAAAAAGTAGFYMWIGASLVLICQIGVSVGVAQGYGRKDLEDVKCYISNGLKLDLMIGIIYSLFLILFRNELIGYFNLDDMVTIDLAIRYLVIIAYGLIFSFINPVFSAIYNAVGNSFLPFVISSLGVIANMVLDPLLIFGIGPFPALGIEGAALATVLSQVLVTIVYLLVSRRNTMLFSHLNLLKFPNVDYIIKIFKLGFPACLQSGIHATISMILTRILAKWGSTTVAVSSIGSQIESITWMTTEGFSSAITAFVGQNYGAKNYKRVKEGYYKGLKIVGAIGIFGTLLLMLAGEPIFKLFTPEDPLAISQGKTYLSILGISQFFVAIEIASAGGFNGLGKTNIPAIIGGVLNALRVPASYILSNTALGMTGVWWSISISSVFKGIILTWLFIYVLKKELKV